MGGEGGGGGGGELAGVVSADVDGGLAVDEGLVAEEGEGMAAGGVAGLGGGEDAVGEVAEMDFVEEVLGGVGFEVADDGDFLGLAGVEVEGGEPAAHAVGVLGEHGAEGAEGGGGDVAVVFVAGEEGHAEEDVGGDGGAAGGGVVKDIAGSDEEGLMVFAGVVEESFVGVPEEVEHVVGELAGFVEPVVVEGELVYGEEAVGEEAVVF